MATTTPTPEELDQQLDAFIDKLVDEKDQLPVAELDDAFWKVRRALVLSLASCSPLCPVGSRATSVLSQRGTCRRRDTASGHGSVASIAMGR